MATLGWLSLILILTLLLVAAGFSLYNALHPQAEESVKPVAAAPMVVHEPQEAVNARVKMSAEIASAFSRIEELEREAEKLKAQAHDRASDQASQVVKLKEDMASISSRVSYQSGAIDTIKADFKTLLEKPPLKIPTTYRINTVAYDGEKLHLAKLKKAKAVEEAKKHNAN